MVYCLKQINGSLPTKGCFYVIQPEVSEPAELEIIYVLMKINLIDYLSHNVWSRSR